MSDIWEERNICSGEMIFYMCCLIFSWTSAIIRRCYEWIEHDKAPTWLKIIYIIDDLKLVTNDSNVTLYLLQKFCDDAQKYKYLSLSLNF